MDASTATMLRVQDAIKYSFHRLCTRWSCLGISFFSFPPASPLLRRSVRHMFLTSSRQQGHALVTRNRERASSFDFTRFESFHISRICPPPNRFLGRFVVFTDPGYPRGAAHPTAGPSASRQTLRSFCFAHPKSPIWTSFPPQFLLQIVLSLARSRCSIFSESFPINFFLRDRSVPFSLSCFLNSPHLLQSGAVQGYQGQALFLVSSLDIFLLDGASSGPLPPSLRRALTTR